jgi:hypothetical protein
MTTLSAEDVVPVPTRAERIENAKQFLKDNLTEITLYNSINRQKKENEDHKKNTKIIIRYCNNMR